MEPSNPAAVDGVSSMSKREYFLDLFWRHKHTTVTLCFVFWSFGMCVAFLGPTLLDLGCKTQTVFSTMSWVFFSQSLLILLGAAAGGVLVERYVCPHFELSRLVAPRDSIHTLPRVKIFAITKYGYMGHNLAIARRAEWYRKRYRADRQASCVYVRGVSE